MWKISKICKLIFTGLVFVGPFCVGAQGPDFGDCLSRVRALPSPLKVDSTSKPQPDPERQQPGLFGGLNDRKAGSDVPKRSSRRLTQIDDQVEISDEALKLSRALTSTRKLLAYDFDSAKKELTVENLMEAIADLYQRANRDFEEAFDAEERQDAKLEMSKAQEALKILTDAGLVNSDFSVASFIGSDDASSKWQQN